MSEDEQGYAITSGDNRTPPVFCITEQGSLNNLDFLENPEEHDVPPGVNIVFEEYDLNYRIAVGLPITDADNILITYI